MTKGLSILVFLLVSSLIHSQEIPKAYVIGKVVEGDTIPVINLREVNIYAWQFLGPKDQKRVTKLMRNVKKVYPYARLAGIKLIEYDSVFASINDPKEKKKLMKELEKEIEAEYGGELRDLTFSQGKILLKLVDRETGHSSYELVSDLRGEFRAVFYQTFARIFGYNLKVKYDPDGEDREIEMIVRMIESGQF